MPDSWLDALLFLSHRKSSRFFCCQRAYNLILLSRSGCDQKLDPVESVFVCGAARFVITSLALLVEIEA